MSKRKVPHDAADEELLIPTPENLSVVTSEPVRDPSGKEVEYGRGGVPVAFEMGDNYYRTLYASEPDFPLLAKQHAGFASVLKHNNQLDFTDPASVVQLTKALLKLDFGLEIDLPAQRLCPPVPNRHNYILWLKDLLDSSTSDRPGSKLSGLDIGTGASCIYPLLGCAQRPWYFVGTDIDAESLSYARKNVALNRLQDKIKILPRKPTDSLIPLDELGLESIDFVMTNPPFYESEDELLSSAAKKSRPPHSACTGAPVEMVCPGGEIGFVGRMLAESKTLRDRIRWYSAMLGKASSVETVVHELRALGLDNYAVKEFVQGTKTRRWAVGWSFGAMRPSQAAARGLRGPLWRGLLPATLETAVLASDPGEKIEPLVCQVKELCQSLELLSWEWNTEELSGVGRAPENVWSRAWRRRKLHSQGGAGTEPDTQRPADSQSCALGFQITIRVGAEAVVRVRWTEGHDAVMFESFCAFVRGRLTPK